MSAAEYSIEGLRREVRRGRRGGPGPTMNVSRVLHQLDLDAPQSHSDADGLPVRSKLINKAMQDIGMGRYHWQLFVLCGFGWFADK